MTYKQMNDFELSCELLRVRTLLRTNPNPHTYHQNKKYLEKLEKEHKKREMNRAITELEQKLIDNQWTLIEKAYKGKRSEKTKSYTYFKKDNVEHENFEYGEIIVLNAKRTQIVDFGLLKVSCDLLNPKALELFTFALAKLKLFIREIKGENERLNKLGVPNSELDERQEIVPMTPEQFDELCQETEKSDNEN